ncbi:glycosyltransferase [Acuticoccus yangtzensis]|uniref:glycosyltransferase n=1 Tax=Acuticoccus yangtzensis TaxID=1443441 RepID=UPI000D3E411C|nr:glycosyltransferase [Acuticoccus yangtzensis]
MSAPLRVLHVTPTFYPATYWGGPIFSTRAVCDGVAGEPGIAVRVLTTDAAGPRPSDRVAERRTTFPAGYDVIYARRVAGRDVAPGLLARLLPAVAKADIVHLTATYSFPTLPTLAACRALGKPVVWSPRGAIQARLEWSEAVSGAKVRFEQAARMLAPQRTVLHVTAPVEAELTARAMPGLTVETIPNSVEIPGTPSTFPRSAPGARPLRLMFLSRVHEKKGCDLLIEALAGVPDATLDIYGYGEPDYVAALRQRAGTCGVADRVTFHGHVDGAARDAAYRAADLFVLPSHSENFGNVIAEALAFAVPVVTTTATPWEEIARRGCGAWVAPEAGAVRDAIARLTDADLAAMGQRGRAFMEAAFSSTVTARAMAALYRRLAGSC